MVPEMKEVTNLFHKVSVWVHLTSSRQTPSKVSHTSFGLPGYSITTKIIPPKVLSRRKTEENKEIAVVLKCLKIRQPQLKLFLSDFWPLFGCSALIISGMLAFLIPKTDITMIMEHVYSSRVLIQEIIRLVEGNICLGMPRIIMQQSCGFTSQVCVICAYMDRLYSS